MLSYTCKTAIKAVIYLASLEDDRKAGIREIAGFIEASEHTVGKILQVLAKENIIHSNKGPNGGFCISATQRTQSVLKVVEAIDGKDVFKQCGLGLSKCSETHPCPFHDEFKIIRNLFKNTCEQKKIIELFNNVNNGLAYLIG